MNYPKVFIIILNWNGLEDTLECLASVAVLNYPNYEIVVVDNDSAEKPDKDVADKYPQVKVILNSKNLGYSGGNNAGIRYALNEKADYVWLLNNDTVVEADALINMISEVEKNADIGIAGSKICYFDCPKKIWFAGSRIDWSRGFTDHRGMGKMDTGQFDSVEEVDRVTGCSMLVRKEVCNKVGVLDENFFLYVEEIDWCVRARKAGFKCIFVPSSVVYHKISASVTKTGNWDKVYVYYDTRNFLYLIKKSFQFPQREKLICKVIRHKLRWEKRNFLIGLLSMTVPGVRLLPSRSPILFAIRDFLIQRMGKVDYKF